MTIQGRRQQRSTTRSLTTPAKSASSLHAYTGVALVPCGHSRFCASKLCWYCDSNGQRLSHYAVLQYRWFFVQAIQLVATLPAANDRMFLWQNYLRDGEAFLVDNCLYRFYAHFCPAFSSPAFSSPSFSSPSFSSPAFSSPALWSAKFQSCIFQPCSLVRHFPVLHFPVLHFQRPRHT